MHNTDNQCGFTDIQLHPLAINRIIAYLIRITYEQLMLQKQCGLSASFHTQESAQAILRDLHGSCNKLPALGKQYIQPKRLCKILICMVFVIEENHNQLQTIIYQ